MDRVNSDCFHRSDQFLVLVILALDLPLGAGRGTKEIFMEFFEERDLERFPFSWHSRIR